MTLADRVRAARAAKGWTQADLAKRLQWHPSWVSQIECGQREPNARNLALLAGALGCKVDALCPAVRP